jgi:hypothetical protein
MRAISRRQKTAWRRASVSSAAAGVGLLDGLADLPVPGRRDPVHGREREVVLAVEGVIQRATSEPVSRATCSSTRLP